MVKNSPVLMKTAAQRMLGVFYALIMLCSTLLCLNSCKSVVEKVEFDTQLIVTAYGNNDQLISNASVGVFTDYQKYKTAITTRDLSLADQNAKTNGGKVEFKTLQADVKYWVACFYADSAKIPGANVTYDNSEINYELAIKLRKGSINEVDIKMQPQTGVVSFFAPSTERNRLPLVVKFNTQVAGTISKTFDSAFLPLVDSTVHVNSPKGTNYYIITSDICSWSGIVSVTGGNREIVNLAPCEAGKLSFFCEDTASVNFPIKISLNGNAIPDLTFTNAKSASDCNTPNLYSVEKASNSYTYNARSANGKCVWVGTAEIKTNDCTIIKLSKCN